MHGGHDEHRKSLEKKNDSTKAASATTMLTNFMPLVCFYAYMKTENQFFRLTKCK